MHKFPIGTGVIDCQVCVRANVFATMGKFREINKEFWKK